jgi:hypothetical protein
VERKTLARRVLSSFLDTLHHWSGTMLAEERGSGSSAPPVEPTAVLPAIQAAAHLIKQPMTALTTFMEPGMADEIAKLAQAMQTSEQDVLVRLIKLAKMIREFGLYGVPTPDGNHLVIHLQKTGENHLVHLECPAQQNHHPASPTKPADKPPSHLN